MIRFEILLPLFYNDGRAVEPEQFLATGDELVALFSATSTDTVVVRGQWKYESTKYSDQLIRVRVDVEDNPENREAMRRVKETLKKRFEQLDIWITSHHVEVIERCRHDQTPLRALVAAAGNSRRLRRLAGADARRLGLAARRGLLPGTADELVANGAESLGATVLGRRTEHVAGGKVGAA